MMEEHLGDLNSSLLPHASGVIYLNVRSDNDRAKKFYERNGMELIDKTSWSDGKIEGDVYQIIVKKNGSQNLDSFFPSFDAFKYAKRLIPYKGV